MTLYLDFKKNFEEAVADANRAIDEVELIAVSKKKSKEDIQKVIDLNHTSFGENQIQEIEKKWVDLKNDNADTKLHYIGNIQSRKVFTVLKI